MADMLSSLMGGGGGGQAREARRQRELQEIAQARAEQRNREESSDVAGALAGTRRAPRGRRLLLSPESGGAEALGAV